LEAEKRILKRIWKPAADLEADKRIYEQISEMGKNFQVIGYKVWAGRISIFLVESQHLFSLHGFTPRRQSEIQKIIFTSAVIHLHIFKFTVSQALFRRNRK